MRELEAQRQLIQWVNIINIRGSDYGFLFPFSPLIVPKFYIYNKKYFRSSLVAICFTLNYMRFMSMAYKYYLFAMFKRPYKTLSQKKKKGKRKRNDRHTNLLSNVIFIFSSVIDSNVNEFSFADS